MDVTSRSTYYYDLPKELIAQNPIEPRDSARLLVYNRKNKSINHKIFKDVIDYLNKGDVLVINTSKVLPARLIGKKETGAVIEVLLLKRLELNRWETLVKPGKRAKVGTKIVFSDNLYCTILDDTDFGGKIVEFTCLNSVVFEDEINKIGLMPLPHYIKETLKDNSKYQTVYANELGSSAAPTAGLHFTEELLNKIKEKGVIIAEVMLHVGLGTFRPVSEDNILNHNMHSEYFEISKEVVDTINNAKKNGNKIVAVGTTSIRTLESAATFNNGVLKEYKGNTNIFIYPGYKFKVVDAIITNFHLPESTLIMLVSAFCGVEETLNMYKVAVENKYRFFSFGDATLLL